MHAHFYKVVFVIMMKLLCFQMSLVQLDDYGNVFNNVNCKQVTIQFELTLLG